MADMNKSENEEKQPNPQLQELKFIGLLASGIIHDFNNVIGVIRGYAELALRSTSSDNRNYAYLEHIIKEADSAKVLAEKMRIFTRQKKPDFKLINIHSIVERAITTFKESLPAPADIQQDMDITCQTVLADADQIQRVVINLCDNAYDALSENGGNLKIILKEIDIGASFAEEYERLNEGRHAKLTISDTGHGMDQDILKRIYEPFFTTKEISEHAGLGLSIVHSVIVRHKGEIVVDSKSDEGTTFDIYLPLVDKN